MGLFNRLFNYDKPGPGVDVDAPPKKPPLRFLELYWRKFSRFILLNLLTFLIKLPIITFIFLMLYMILDVLTGGELLGDGTEAVFFGLLQNALFWLASVIPFPLAALMLLASVVFYGPLKCGLAYIYRNFSREEHAWLSDLWSQMRKNFKQGAVIGVIELLVISLLFMNLLIRPEEAENITFFLPAIQFASIFLLIMIFFARRYFYLITVTFKLPIYQIIKNSIAFAFVGLWRNALLSVFGGLLLVALIGIPYFDVIFLPLFFFSLTGFLSAFATFPLVDKHMLKPALERKEAETEEEK